MPHYWLTKFGALCLNQLVQPAHAIHICKLRSILQSRVLLVVYGFVKDKIYFEVDR